MAGLAAVRCSDMVDRLAGGHCTVMAGHTGTDYLCVVHLAGWLESRGDMAALALRAGKNMCQVFAGSHCTVMAGSTGADYLRVIHLAGRLEGRSHMAAFTGITGQNMRGVLAGRRRTVVAGRTTGGDSCVIKASRFPGQGAMAGLASTGRGYMTE